MDERKGSPRIPLIGRSSKGSASLCRFPPMLFHRGVARSAPSSTFRISSFCSSPRVKTAINPKKKEENRLRRSFEKIFGWLKVVVARGLRIHSIASDSSHAEAWTDFNEISNATNALKRSIKGLVVKGHDTGQRSHRQISILEKTRT